MEDDNTTVTQQPSDTGADTALPVNEPADNPAGEQSVTEPSEAPQDGQEEAQATEQTTAPQVDDKLSKYAASQGLELDSPSAIKAAQIAMKAQSEATRNYQKANELEKTMTGVSDDYAEQVAQTTGENPEMLKRLQRMEVKTAVQDFWNNPLATGDKPDRQLEQAMVQELQAKPHLAGDLESLYAAVAFKQGTMAAKSQGGREALTSLAHKQQAAVPTGHATNPSATPVKKDIHSMSIKEIEQKYGFVRQ